MRHKLAWLAAGLPLLILLQSCTSQPQVEDRASSPAMSHERRSAAAHVDDQIIELKVLTRLQQDEELSKHSSVSATSYNHVLLLTGQADDARHRERFARIAANVPKVKRVVNEVQVAPGTGISETTNDAYLTTRVKLELFSIDLPGFAPSYVKVVTERGAVHLMGVLTVQEANAVVEKARYVRGVKKVVKVFEYIP